MKTGSVRLAPEGGALEGYLEALLEQGAGTAAREPAEAEAHGIESLVVRTGGVAVALPQRSLEATLPWPDRLARPPRGAPSWFVGRMRHGRAWLPVADLAALILPPGCQGRLAEPAVRLRWVLLVEAVHMRWGLACESVTEPTRLAPAALRPREPAWPAWLAGTVPARRLLVVDVHRLIDQMSREAGIENA